jgi:hypothetical protein
MIKAPTLKPETWYYGNEHRAIFNFSKRAIALTTRVCPMLAMQPYYDGQDYVMLAEPIAPKVQEKMLISSAGESTVISGGARSRLCGTKP